jgi:hypothetical protein
MKPWRKNNEKLGRKIPLAKYIRDPWHQDKFQSLPVIISATRIVANKLQDLQYYKNIAN